MTWTKNYDRTGTRYYEDPNDFYGQSGEVARSPNGKHFVATVHMNATNGPVSFGEWFDSFRKARHWVESKLANN